MIEDYLDPDWYFREYGKMFSTKRQFSQYYFSEGERKGELPNPLFNPSYYKKLACVPSSVSPLKHYFKNKAKICCNTSLYFNPYWYRWQNGDVGSCSLLHYLQIGGRQYRDPCPEVDMTALARSFSSLGDGSYLTYLATNSGSEVATHMGVTPSPADLVARQRNFLSQCHLDLIIRASTPVKGRNLVFVQCGNDSEFWNWFDTGASRDWDLFVNCYDGLFSKDCEPEYVCLQRGTKFTGMFQCWQNYSEIFDNYDYVFFIDDDLIFNFEDISNFFQLTSIYKLDFSQPSLSKDSHCVWKCFFNARSGGFRYTNGVEIMMPCFSKKALNAVLPYFVYSVSGFGLDLFLAKKASERLFKSGVIDDIVVKHCKNIDQESGAYYELLRSFGINSKYELWRMIELFDLEFELCEI
ncbi:MAG: hypothetical protein KUA37_13585 [Desulfomicrobium sp.]|nr:hypothetical protein [Pseudomonadota bacterium]MBV1713016.1 hypothetical protein [Desulfomicrobium sp.]MBU4571986.1 hypothetical protein [Pseudomonadota bacterium]MBU4596135.1 hypothetical protein [Pseudomonadota bacterium]MBV1721439.1 hypothetical protein [Desulfomicrobium sp.]